MLNLAPDFTPGYPSAGVKIGPAWSAAWDILADGRWHKGTEIAGAIRGEMAQSTIMNLLRKAVLAGHLQAERRYGGSLGGGRVIRPTWYRRADLPTVD